MPPENRSCPGVRYGWEQGWGQLRMVKGPGSGAPFWGLGYAGEGSGVLWQSAKWCRAEAKGVRLDQSSSLGCW